MKPHKPMSADEKRYWRGVGNHIAFHREKFTAHGLDDDRRTRAVTQKDLGKAVGLSRCSIANIERGAQRTDCYTYHKMMEFLRSSQ